MSRLHRIRPVAAVTQPVRTGPRERIEQLREGKET